MEKMMIILLLIIVLTVVLPVNSLFAIKGNESFINQDKVNLNANISSLVYDLRPR